MKARVEAAVKELVKMLKSTESLEVRGFVGMFKLDEGGRLYLTKCTSLRSKQENLLGQRNPIVLNMSYSEATQERHNPLTVLLPSRNFDSEGPFAFTANSSPSRHRKWMLGERFTSPLRKGIKEQQKLASFMHARDDLLSPTQPPSEDEILSRTSTRPEGRLKGANATRRLRQRHAGEGIVEIDVASLCSEDLTFLEMPFENMQRGQNYPDGCINVVCSPKPHQPMFLTASEASLHRKSKAPEASGDSITKWRNSRNRRTLAPDPTVEREAKEAYRLQFREELQELTPSRCMPSDIYSAERRALYDFLVDALYKAVVFRGDSLPGKPSHGLESLQEAVGPTVDHSTVPRYKFMLPPEFRSFVSHDQVDILIECLALGREFAYDQELGVRVDVLFMRSPRPVSEAELVDAVLKIFPPHFAQNPRGSAVLSRPLVLAPATLEFDDGFDTPQKSSTTERAVSRPFAASVDSDSSSDSHSASGGKGPDKPLVMTSSGLVVQSPAKPLTDATLRPRTGRKSEASRHSAAASPRAGEGGSTARRMPMHCYPPNWRLTSSFPPLPSQPFPKPRPPSGIDGRGSGGPPESQLTRKTSIFRRAALGLVKPAQSGGESSPAAQPKYSQALAFWLQ